MHQAIRQRLIVCYAISLSLLTVFVLLFQPIPTASAQQLTKRAIGMSPTRLFFTAHQGGSTPAAQTLTINNTGDSSLPWGVSHDAPWLVHTPGRGTGTGTVTISVIPGSLPAGTYSGQVTLWPTGATPVTVPVTFTVTAATPASAPPAIGLTPTSLSFTAQQGGSNPPAQTVAVSNRGSGTLNWGVSHDAPWLAHAPGRGTGTGAVTVGVTTGTLTAGTHRGQVTLWPTGATPVTVPVTFTVTAATPASAPPAIGLTPTSLSFTAQQGGSNPPAQTVAVSNRGSGTLNWGVSHDAPWLAHTPGRGTGTGAVTVGVTTGTLTVGTHRGQVTLWPTGATPVTVPVTFTVTAATPASAPPAIGLTPTSLSFTAQQGGSNPPAQTVAVSNRGSGTLNWGVSHDAPWLAHTPGRGTGTGAVTVGVTTGTLTAGTHRGQVTLWPTGATPVTVPVTFTVTAASAPPAIGMSPTRLSFTAQQGSSNPAAQTVAITNKGGGTLTWSVSDNMSWLAPSPTSGTGNGVATISVTTGPLKAGIYNGIVTLSATGATPVTVPVTFTVTAATPASAPPAIGLTPTSLSFTAQQGGSNPPAQTVAVSNRGSGTLNWGVSHDAPWLAHTPGRGTGTGAVTVGVTTGTLTAGTHRGQVTLWPTGATPVTVPVTFTVTAASAPPAIGMSPTRLSFTAQQGSSNPAAQTVAITNKGGGTLTWSVNDNASWLAPSPTSRTGNGVATISVTTGSLKAGTYNGIVTLSATGAASVTVPVTFIITPIAFSASTTINLSPSSLSYAATQGAANPTNQNISLTTTGGTVNWTVSDDASWLAVNLTSGSDSRTLTASVNTAGVPVGTHNGTITVSAAGISPRTVTVTLTVNAPATSSATLTWKANTESDLAGYKIYRATTSGGYGAPIATAQGNITTYIATGLQVGTTYFFVITSYDLSGNESRRSNEVSKSIF